MVVEVAVVGVKAMEVMTKGANKGVMVEDVVFVSALIVIVRIIQ